MAYELVGLTENPVDGYCNCCFPRVEPVPDPGSPGTRWLCERCGRLTRCAVCDVLWGESRVAAGLRVIRGGGALAYCWGHRLCAPNWGYFWSDLAPGSGVAGEVLSGRVLPALEWEEKI